MPKEESFWKRAHRCEDTALFVGNIFPDALKNSCTKTFLLFGGNCYEPFIPSYVADYVIHTVHSDGYQISWNTKSSHSLRSVVSYLWNFRGLFVMNVKKRKKIANCVRIFSIRMTRKTRLRPSEARKIM